MQNMKKGIKRKGYRRTLALLLVMALVLMPLENVTGFSLNVSSVAEAEDTTNSQYPYFANEGATAVSSSAIGSAEKPLQISTAGQLRSLATLVLNETDNENYYIESEKRYAKYAECSYVLTQDIDLSGISWIPIGTPEECNSDTDYLRYPFQGSFDGKSYTIRNMNIEVTSNNYWNQGLFGSLSNGAAIRNLKMESSKITGSVGGNLLRHIGFLVGSYKDNSGNTITIENCHIGSGCEVAVSSTAFSPLVTDYDSLGDENADSYMVGGLVGGPDVYLEDQAKAGKIEIKNCSNAASVTGTGVRTIGGIIGGCLEGTISDCTNDGAVTGTRNVGGIIGKTDSASINNCTNTGVVTAEVYSEDIWNSFSSSVTYYEQFLDDGKYTKEALQEYDPGSYVGGIAGKSSGKICDAANSGVITGCGSSIGGVIGASDAGVERAVNTGKIMTASYGEHKVGGSSQVSFQSEEKDVGGIAGSIASGSAYVTDCINQGSVSGNAQIGGILGNGEAVGNDAVTYPVRYSYNTGTVSVGGTEVAGQIIGTAQTAQNSYYLADIANKEEDNGESNGTLPQKSAREFASGEVCYHLDHDADGALRGVWSQNIETEAYPVLSKDTTVSYPVHEIKVSTLYTEITWTKYEYCNDNAAVKAAANIIEETGYAYSYYLVGAGGVTDLTEVSETEEITENCHIAVKREEKTTPTESPTTSPSTSPSESPSVTSRPSYPVVVVTPTPSPTVSPSPSPSVSPTPTATATPTPTATVTPIPEQTTAPVETETPKPENTPSPSAKPDSTKAPSVTSAPGEVGSTVKKSGTKYEVTGKVTVSVDKVDAKKAKVTIPATVTIAGKKMKVTEIADNAFVNNKKVEKVTVGKNIEKIGKQAFKNCKNLEKITLSAKTTSVGAQCFANCTSLKNVYLPNSVKTIGKEAFKNCKDLKTVKIGKKTETKAGGLSAADFGAQKVKTGKLELKITVGNGAFQNCTSLRSVIINTQVRVIGNSAFKNCKSLASIIVRSLILKTVGKKALTGVSDCKISVPKKKYTPYRKLFKNKGQGKKVFVAKA